MFDKENSLACNKIPVWQMCNMDAIIFPGLNSGGTCWDIDEGLPARRHTCAFHSIGNYSDMEMGKELSGFGEGCLFWLGHVWGGRPLDKD